jgi:uncharacterized protein YndB with AHSA1/START domain
VNASPAKNSPVADTSGDELVITRVFDAPRALVWQAWSEPQALRRWWGPKGFAMGLCRLEFRPGGIFHYSMRTPDGRDLWGKFVYREIVAPERIVFVSSFADEGGNVVRNPWNAGWPLETHNTLTFAEHAGKTTLTLRGGPLNATAAERKIFEDGLQSMQRGFAGTFDQLAEYLAKT